MISGGICPKVSGSNFDRYMLMTDIKMQRAMMGIFLKIQKWRMIGANVIARAPKVETKPVPRTRV